MTFLAIDTSTSRGSVALLEDERMLLEETFLADRSHSASLFTVLERARAAASRIDRVVIGLGPGSYAGVRIAIAAALGFQLALGAKLIGIPSVASLETDEREYHAIGDARRDSFYFTHVREGVCVEGPLLGSLDEVRARIAAHSLPVFGTDALATFPEARVALPSAVTLARLAATARGIVAEDILEPIYLREAYITPPRGASAQPLS